MNGKSHHHYIDNILDWREMYTVLNQIIYHFSDGAGNIDGKIYLDYRHHTITIMEFNLTTKGNFTDG
jgi:hypothetical protein